MGGMGSDLAIETADVVIQTDQPSKIPTAIKIGKNKTNRHSKYLTCLWSEINCIDFRRRRFGYYVEAVFADVGVAL